MDEEELKSAIVGAGEDETGGVYRRDLANALALAFREAGKCLWLCGAVIGSDRVDGVSPFGFGSDATVGLGTVVQIAGELCSGAITLLRDGNRYAAAALLRQVVEVEYLAWAFAEDEAEAMNWLRSNREERMQFWQPRHIRKRAGDRFRGRDYALHCEAGGHPTPDGNRLLSTSNEKQPDFFEWNDLIFHGLSVWDYTIQAADRLGYGEELRALPEAKALNSSRRERAEQDPLVPLLGEALSWLNDNREERASPSSDSA
jgi:hypothetical protein